MNGIQHQNPLDSFQKDTAMSESIRRDANLDTSEDQATLLDDMTIENASSRVSLPKEGCEASKNQMSTQNQVKSKHREQEKVRKLKINENIDRLLELIPNEQKVKLSKNQILETTYDYICDLRGKCHRYMTMDTGSLQEERVNELLAENDRLRKENECFLEIFRTLNIQPNGLLEMNHQLKSVKRDDKFAQNLLSPNQSVNQSLNLMLSPTGQPCDPSLQPGSQLSGPSLLSPTVMNGNLVMSQPVEGMAQDATQINAGQQSFNTELKKESSSHEESHQTDDMDQVFQEIMEATKSSPPLVKSETVEHTQRETSSECENTEKDSGNNLSSMSLTSSGQAFNVSTHQPSVTANEAQPKLTCAATTPATMVTQSLSRPIVTTAGCTLVSTAGQNQMSSQPMTNVTSNLKVVVPPTTTATVGGVQQNVMLQQQQGQTLLISLPGRPGLIPVKITHPAQKSNQPVLLPNQGQCGNLAKQLNPTGQKRRPLKIKEQGKDGAPKPPGPTLTLQPQVLGAPSATQTMTVRLPVGANPPTGNVVWNGNQMVMQPTVQQPVVINTPGGGQQTVLMQVPLQIQQPVVQQPQQVVYIQQNGQLIPVVVNPPQQQVVSNPVIVNPVQQQQNQQGPEQRSSAAQTVTTSAEPQPSVAEPSISSEASQQQGDSLQHIFANQGNVGTSVSSALPSSVVTTCQANGIPHVNLNDQSAFQGGSLSVNQYEADRESMPNSQFTSPFKPPMSEGNHQNFSNHQNFNNGTNMDVTKLGDIQAGDDCMDANDILAQAAEHIFPQSGGDGSHQGDGVLGIDSSSNQEEERSHKSSKKKKKKSKSKEKDKDKGKESKKDKKSRKGKKKAQEEPIDVNLEMAKDNNLPSSSQAAILEKLLQDTEQAALENDGSGSRIEEVENGDLSTVSGNTNIVSSQGMFMSDYTSQPSLSQATSTTASKVITLNSGAAIARGESPDGTDILSNSMNFIGLPTLGEESDQQTDSKGTEQKEMVVREEIGTSNAEEGDAEDEDEDDDEDDDPEAHAFSPPVSPDGDREVSPSGNQQQMEEVNLPTSEGFSKLNNASQNSYSEADSSARLTHGMEKSPPPAYPGASLKVAHREHHGGQVKPDLPHSRVTSQPLDILSQPWLNPTTVSMQQNFGPTPNVQFQKSTMPEALQIPSSQTASPYDNITSLTRENEPQPLSSSHAVTLSQTPVSTTSSHPPFRPGVTESHQMTRPTFNFYSQPSTVATTKTSNQVQEKNSIPIESSGVTTIPSSVPPVSVGLFPTLRQTGGTLMRMLEKPPLSNKSFTKANIHRTLTSFDKVEQEKDEKWAKEKEQVKSSKEPFKPPVPPKSAPGKPDEEVDDSVGHRALDRDLVNKFPWLADGDEPKGNKPNTSINKSSRNPTPFSVQSMAQSSAQSSVSRKRQDKNKRAQNPKQPVTGKNSQQQGDGNSWNLWNPSFSRSGEKPRHDVNDDDVMIISDSKEALPYKEIPERMQLSQANSKSITTSGISSSVDAGNKPKRKGQQSLKGSQTPTQTKSTPDISGGKDANQATTQLNLDNTLPMYPASQSQPIHVSDSLITSLPQYNSGLLTSDSQTSTSKLFSSKNTSQYPFPKSSPVENSGSSLQTTQERDHPNSGDIFPNPVNLDFLFEKTDQSDLTDNMVDSLQSDPTSTSQLGKQSPLSGLRNTPYEQVAVSNSYSQQNPINLGRQPSQGGQRMSNSQQARSLSSHASGQGVKRTGNELQMHSGPPKRHKEVDLFRGSPMSDGNHMGSPDNSSGSYGSPVMPGDQQSSGLGDRPGSFRYQHGIQGYAGQQSPNVSSMQSGYNLGRGDQGSSKKSTSHPPIDTAEVKRTKGLSAQERNADIEVQSWSSQSMTSIAQGSSRGNSRHMERSTQNTQFMSELPSPTLPSGFSQNDVTASPANSALLSSLSPTRHLRPNELPTYLPSIPVRNSILTSPPYPGKTTSTRDADMSFDSMFSSSRSNSLPLNVPHNYSMFSDHPSHNSGLSTVKHGHMTSHVGNSSAPFNFNNIFHDAPISTSQGHPNPTQSLNHTLHPAILGNSLQSPVEEGMPSLRGGVNQRHRNQQLGNTTMRLDHLLGQNPTVDARGTFPVGPMGVPPHLSNPFVSGMPPF